MASSFLPEAEKSQQRSDWQLDSAWLWLTAYWIVVQPQMVPRGQTDLRPPWRSYGASQRGTQAQISLGGLSHLFDFIHMTGYMEGCVLSGCSGLKGLSDRHSCSIAQVWACFSDNKYTHTQEDTMDAQGSTRRLVHVMCIYKHSLNNML